MLRLAQLDQIPLGQDSHDFYILPDLTFKYFADVLDHNLPLSLLLLSLTVFLSDVMMALLNY